MLLETLELAVEIKACQSLFWGQGAQPKFSASLRLTTLGKLGHKVFKNQVGMACHRLLNR